MARRVPGYRRRIPRRKPKRLISTLKRSGYLAAPHKYDPKPSERSRAVFARAHAILKWREGRISTAERDNIIGTAARVLSRHLPSHDHGNQAQNSAAHKQV